MLFQDKNEEETKINYLLKQTFECGAIDSGMYFGDELMFAAQTSDFAEVERKLGVLKAKDNPLSTKWRYFTTEGAPPVLTLARIGVRPVSDQAVALFFEPIIKKIEHLTCFQLTDAFQESLLMAKRENNGWLATCYTPSGRESFAAKSVREIFGNTSFQYFVTAKAPVILPIIEKSELAEKTQRPLHQALQFFEEQEEADKQGSLASESLGDNVEYSRSLELNKILAS